jgi:hypothetical protein
VDRSTHALSLETAATSREYPELNAREVYEQMVEVTVGWRLRLLS